MTKSAVTASSVGRFVKFMRLWTNKYTERKSAEGKVHKFDVENENSNFKTIRLI